MAKGHFDHILRFRRTTHFAIIIWNWRSCDSKSNLLTQLYSVIMYREYHRNDPHAITSRLWGHLRILGNKNSNVHLRRVGGKSMNFASKLTYSIIIMPLENFWKILRLSIILTIFYLTFELFRPLKVIWSFNTSSWPTEHKWAENDRVGNSFGLYLWSLKH